MVIELSPLLCDTSSKTGLTLPCFERGNLNMERDRDVTFK